MITLSTGPTIDSTGHCGLRSILKPKNKPLFAPVRSFEYGDSLNRPQKHTLVEGGQQTAFTQLAHERFQPSAAPGLLGDGFLCPEYGAFQRFISFFQRLEACVVFRLILRNFCVFADHSAHLLGDYILLCLQAVAFALQSAGICKTCQCS